MPRKRVLTKTQVIDSAFSLVRRKGIESLNSRNLAKECGTSTQPIFTLFDSMQEIQKAVKDKAYEVYDAILKETLSSDNLAYKAVGLSYLGFAMKEPNLFKLLFMHETDQTYSNLAIDHNAPQILEEIKTEYGLSEKYAKKLYFESWVYTHGLATMLVTKTISISPEDISETMRDVVRGTCLFLKEQMKGKEK